MIEERQALRITKMEQINSNVRYYRLESAWGVPLAPLQAGQYINLFYEIDGATTSRPYSIASSPGDAKDGFYELYIHGGGPFTARWLFEHAQEGDVLQASAPVGDFCPELMRDGQNIIGISGGMSVTPLRSMARAVMDGSLDANLTLFCGWDTEEEVLFREEFARYAASNPRFRAVFSVAVGAVGCETGYVTLDMLRRHAALEDAAFFLCGPAAMYKALDQELASLYISEEKYHRELPGEAREPKNIAGYPDMEQKAFRLFVHMDGKETAIVADSQETILVAMERAGLYPPARCRSGKCRVCGSSLLAGQVFVPEAWDIRTEEEREIGYVHPCCSFPLSDIVLVTPSDELPKVSAGRAKAYGE